MADTGEAVPVPFSERRHSHSDGGSRNNNGCGGGDPTESKSKSAAGSKEDVAVAVPDENLAGADFESNGDKNPFQDDRLPLWERDQKMPTDREEEEEEEQRHQVRGKNPPKLRPPGSGLTLQRT